MISSGEIRNFLIYGVLLALVATLPFWGQDYWLTIGVTIASFAAMVTSWSIFSGPTHYISLSTAAFFGVGTYTTALGIEYFPELPYWTLLVIAGGLGAVMALLVGLTTLRLSGVYFVIFTLGLAELVRQVVTWLQNWSGQKGLYVLTDLGDREIYWQFIGLSVLVYIVGWLIQRSKVGLALRVIGDDEDVAKHAGIHTSRLKVLLFMIPGAGAAIAGAILAPRYIYIEPMLAFTPLLSFQVVIMALLGGTGRLWGGLIGVIPFVLVWEAIAISMPNQTTLLLGVAFLVIVYFIPKGFVGILLGLRRRMMSGGREG